MTFNLKQINSFKEIAFIVSFPTPNDQRRSTAVQETGRERGEKAGESGKFTVVVSTELQRRHMFQIKISLLLEQP